LRPLLYTFATVAAFACGSRTGLELAEPPAAGDEVALADVALSADASPEAEAGHDAGAPHDAMFRDVPALDICPDAGATLVYVLTEGSILYSFYPPTLAFRPIGVITCPTAGTQTPFSMAVDRRGIAYSVFTGGRLFRIDTANAACQTTPFTPNQEGFGTFGMGFTANTGDAGETLFVAEGTAMATKPPSRGLGRIDTASYVLTYAAPFGPSIPGPELTGTSDGRLFAFFTTATTGSRIVEVNKTTGAILSTDTLAVGTPNDAYAFAFWGGEFWIFTSSSATSQVTRFDPATKTETPATTFDGIIVGAGVSTCAPQ
jgi:hypothetical protein